MSWMKDPQMSLSVFHETCHVTDTMNGPLLRLLFVCVGVVVLWWPFILTKFGMMKSATKCATSVGMATVSVSYLPKVAFTFTIALWIFTVKIRQSGHLCNGVMDVFSDYITMDITQHARDVVEIVEMAASMDEKLTPLKVCEAWMGKGPAKRRKMIKVTSLSRLEVESIIIHLLLHGYFRYFDRLWTISFPVLDSFSNSFLFYTQVRTLASLPTQPTSTWSWAVRHLSWRTAVTQSLWRWKGEWCHTLL